MRKALFIGFMLLMFVVACKSGGKAIAAVPGDHATQARSYLDSAEQAIDSGDYQTGYAYLVHAESAISKIPYAQRDLRLDLQERYDRVYQKYETVSSGMSEI